MPTPCKPRITFVSFSDFIYPLCVEKRPAAAKHVDDIGTNDRREAPVCFPKRESENSDGLDLYSK